MKDAGVLRRRDFLKCCAAGSVGLHAMLAQAAQAKGGHPLASKPTHFPAKAKNLIIVFLTGGFSHVDTFDYKPKLQADHGKEFFALDSGAEKPSRLFYIRSPFRFEPRGKSGLLVSELFPKLGSIVDKLCVIRSMKSDNREHFQATLAMHTGSDTVPLPSIGAWLSYGLGTFERNLPPYVVLAEHMPYAGAQNWDCNFLPPEHQGVRLLPGHEPIADLRSGARSVSLQELERIMLNDVNEMHASERPHDLGLAARSTSFETAQGMMRDAPQVFDLTKETDNTLQLYGMKRGDVTSVAWQCLVARRLVERGVRTVELIDTGANNNWDAHGNMQDHRAKALRVDQAITALIEDLEQRGLLKQTLVAVCTEFGRTPWGATPNDQGRNHHARAFTCLLAGAGVKGGMAYGESDEHGTDVASDLCHVHDYHATILHLMGVDHKKLTYRYAGRDFRLTDVHGNVLHKILT